MIKKNKVTLYIVMMFIGAFVSLVGEQMASGVMNETMVIPDDAIRLRILANSDNDEDQELKRKIRDRVNEEITIWVSDITSREEARSIIQGNIPEIEKIVEEVMKAEGLTQKYNVDFGRANFPTKMYGRFIYPAGDYEAILITLGSGKGANWWCVLFPPLCFLDFSNGEATATPFPDEDEETTEKPIVVDEEPEEVEVKFFFAEFLSSLWKKISGK
ncbi:MULTISPECIES: stage II sporulation protein R [Bacillus]|uniref:stage II sporulation protein R n=1 Tax=Bacillus TaxID=1386 RepID=UPI000BB87CF9|nr:MULTISPECIES: stage II sporulation protein R [Bacillus]